MTHGGLDRAARLHFAAEICQKRGCCQIARELSPSGTAHPVADDGDGAALAPEMRAGGAILILLVDASCGQLRKKVADHRA